MRRTQWHLLLGAIIVFSARPVKAGAQTPEDSGFLHAAPQRVWGTVKQDYREFYMSRSRLIHLGIGFGAGAIMANTDIDENLRDWYQRDVRSDDTDDLSVFAKKFGEGKYLIPITVLSALADEIFHPGVESSPLGTWGGRAARAYLVGTPALLAAQRITGGCRPNEDDPCWQPFNDDNGVSGHAFIGAVPFLTAGRMCQDNHLARYALYAASALPVLSRINDDCHYPSQALLGWFLAWESTGAVFSVSNRDQRVSLAPMVMRDGYGLSLCIEW